MSTRLSFAAALLLFSIDPSGAANQARASFVWTGAQLAALRITRDQKQINLTNRKVDLVFKDPRNKSEIEKILLDPQYRPGDSGAADFFLETSITSPVTKKKVNETALCYWNGDPSGVSPKSIAVCSIEDDGGRSAVVLENRANSLATSRFALLILKLDGYSGFRIAEDVAANEIVVQVKKAGVPIRAAMKFANRRAAKR